MFDRISNEEMLSLPFDQYQRHRSVAEVIAALRPSPAQPLTVLDVGGGQALTRQFLYERDTIISVDLQPDAPRHSVIADGRALPFADETFDFSVTVDTLEHVQPTGRSQFVDDCLRVCRKGLVLVAPFASPENTAAERLLASFLRSALGTEHPHLNEHLQHGLPDLASLEAHLDRSRYSYIVQPSGYVHRWLAMMVTNHYVASLPNGEPLRSQINRYYNRYYYANDQRPPGYRSVVFISKTRDRKALNTVQRALVADVDANVTSGEAMRDLAIVGLLVDTLALGASTHLERSLSETLSALYAKEAELATTRELLGRIEQGRVMRLLNWLDRS